MINKSRIQNPGSNARRGVTLTEVLMSMLIMSIGISFVAAVFPLSVLRAIQASQLTSATIHRYGAEAMIDVFPDLVLNPDGYTVGAGPDLVHGNADDRPGEQYREHRGRNYIVDPWGYHIHLQDGTAFDREDRPDGSGSTFNNTPWSQWFGVDGGNYSAIQRFDGGITALNPQPGGVANAVWAKYLEHLASRLAASTDRWDKVVDSEDVVLHSPGGFAIGVTFGPDVDLTMLTSPAVPTPGVADQEMGRVTVFDPFGRQSQTYPITNITGQTIIWSEDLDSDGNLDTGEDFNANGALDQRVLPSRLGAVGHVTVELSQARLFTWIMSVRNSSTFVGVDVAVLFNRGVSPEREHAYQATFVPGSNLVGIEYDSTSEPEPFIKKGGYVFDAQRCYWYRIHDVRESPPEYPGYEFVLSVDNVRAPGGEDLLAPVLNQTLDAGEDANGNNALDFGRAVLLPGVVEVYPLGSIQIPEDI